MPPRLHLEEHELEKVAKILDDYLGKTKWEPIELAKRADVSRSQISHARAARKPIGPIVALQIERATTEAFESGATKVAPLRAVDLCPTLARMRRTKKTRRRLAA